MSVAVRMGRQWPKWEDIAKCGIVSDFDGAGLRALKAPPMIRHLGFYLEQAPATRAEAEAIAAAGPEGTPVPLTTLERLQKAVGLPPKQDFHFCGLLTYHPSTDEERAASPRWREAHEVHRSAEILTAVPAVPGVGEQQRGHPSSGVVPTVRCVRDPWATEPVAPAETGQSKLQSSTTE